MQSFAEIFRRNRTVIVLFTVLVILPSLFLGYLGLRAVRSDDVEQQLRQRSRQREIGVLLNGELKSWLFSGRPDGAASQALIRFNIDGDRIVFPDFDLSIRQEGQRNPVPVDSPRSGLLAVPDVREIEQVYYPRIQFFLRDFKLGQNPGAQYFRRLNAMIVQIPGSPNGYVLRSSNLMAFSKLKLDQMTASDSFQGVLQIDEPGEPESGGEDVVTLNDFTFLHVAFMPKETGPNLRRNILLYSTILLTVITVLGGLFLYRAVSYEVAMVQLRADFVSAVSHEFRTPLSSMLALLERVESGRVVDEDMLQRYHQTLRQEARRLGLLVDKLLDFAQLEAGKKHLSFERVDLDEIIDEAISGLHQSSLTAHVEHTTSEQGSPALAFADRTAIIHCVQNLIENAMKYSPANASVLVRSGRQDDGAPFAEVIDDGIGISSHDQKKIFDKFYRAENARALNVQGTGIGLALVKRIMDIHGGSITVASTPGKGSRFRLVFRKREDKT